MKKFLLLLCICLLAFSIGCKNTENSKLDLSSNEDNKGEIAVSEETKSEETAAEEAKESEDAEADEKSESSEKAETERQASGSSKTNKKTETDTDNNTQNTATASKTSGTVPLVHKNTEVRNKKSATTTSEGYTGDTYCKDCGTKISSGKTIAMLKLSKETYELPDHSTITVDKGTDLFNYTLDLAHKSANSKYSGVEKEILKLINEERKKAGIGALSWNSKVYYYANKRATECHTCFDHTRPNGKDWYTVFTDANVLLDGELGENLAVVTGVEAKELAAQVVKSWMNSPTHRANILDPAFKSTAISIVSYGDEFCIEACFCG